MIDLFKHFMSYFFDKSTPNTSKITGFIILVFLVIIFNDIIGFSFYYNKGRKIDLLQNIEELKQLNPNNSKLISTLEQEEKEILNRKTYYGMFIDLFSSEKMDDDHTSNLPAITNPVLDTTPNSFTRKYTWEIDSLVLKNKDNTFNEYVSYNSKPSIKNIKNVTLPSQNSRSQFWHTISSSFALILLMLGILLITPFYYKQLNGEVILGLIILEILGALLVWGNQFLFGLIPVIKNTPSYNYALNIFLHIVINSLVIWAIVAANKKKKR